MKEKVILAIAFFICFGFRSVDAQYTLPDYGKNSPPWHERNDAYIPSPEEQKVLIKRAEESGMTFDLKSDDYDGDGVVNQYDPSPYDWREIGYQPFATLAFLNWDHQWNYYAFKGENLDKAVAGLKKLGISFVRFDFSWNDLELEQGKWNFEKYDRIVNLLSENNIRILGIFSYCAGWAAQPPDYLWCAAPAENHFFTTYVREVIKRYKHKVKYWEIWNEPDSRNYWRPQDMLVKYTSLLKDTYQVAKQEDPTCKILVGGLVDGYKLEWIYNNGGKGYFDIVNFHILISPFRPSPLKAALGAVAQTKRVMDRFGEGDKRIWLTELGCPGVPQNLPVQNWWNGKNPTEEEQGEWVKTVFTEFVKEPQIDKVFWAFFRDTKAHFGNGVDYFGLIGWDFSEKPGYSALEEIIRNWQSPK